MQVETVGLLLAAGNSKRLGIPKQLVRIQGKTLVNRAIDQLLHAGCTHVIVVLGYKADQVSALIESHGTRMIQCVFNPAWSEGQASSLRCGIDFIQRKYESDHRVLIALCDQPMIPISHYTQLIRALLGDKKISATSYPEGGGVPACFDRSAMGKLQECVGEDGAKHWIRLQPNQDIELVQCTEALYDLDTPANLEELTSKLTVGT